jgi:hypothetical protein
MTSSVLLPPPPNPARLYLWVLKSEGEDLIEALGEEFGVELAIRPP